MSSESPRSKTEEIVIQRLPLGREMVKTEDWWAIWIGFFLLLATWYSVSSTSPPRAQTSTKTEPAATKTSEAPSPLAAVDKPVETAESQAESSKKVETPSKQESKKEKRVSPLKPWIAKLHGWDSNPLAAFGSSEKGYSYPALLALGGGLLLIFAFASAILGIPVPKFVAAFIPVFLLTVLALLLSEQKVIKYYNLESVLWALLVGLILSNTLGVPAWWKPAIRTEFYIKTGLVLLGAEVLFGELLALGIPGICVSWIVTPIVLIGTYIFGQRVLKLESRSLNLVISADMSVCGVSAAIATGAACRAKKEELSLAIGLSLTFTVIMMIVQPLFIKSVGMDPAVGGAWLGGTIDSTGAVVAAGNLLPDPAKTVAATVKMIQNILIGVVAFGVAVYWVTYVDRQQDQVKPDIREVWYRFPKFILGFVAASALFSFLHASSAHGPAVTSAVTDVTKSLRGWLFAMAFVSIGLESNFRQLAVHLKGGKPLTLYLCGQALNLILTLFMAWLMFGVLYREAVSQLGK